MVNNVLAVGAHPDDIELGCAGTLLKHMANGDNVYALIMTDGENGNHACITKECFSSMKLLGLSENKIFFGRFPDGSLAHDIKTVNLIEKYLNELQINKVYTHYHNDRHQDHRNCSLAVSSAARKIHDILFFEGPSTNTPFESRYFVELSRDEFNKKAEAIKCYQTQIAKGVVKPDITESLARLHGAMHNVDYAEAFAVHRLFRSGKDV